MRSWKYIWNDDVPVAVRNVMWFQHDKTPAHCCLNVRNYVKATLSPCWIGRGGPVSWPPFSSDLLSKDSFLWGHHKALICESPIYLDLIARLSIAAATIRETPGVFERVHQPLARRWQN
ncbi:hypothetical protein AVEN_243123-1 [Araneus ventricosus]|uniref:Uncharacterized protein n=1 Tax=Araneus ventricosus TaxID=182803 RepID=A0A4Y2NIB7_ARAVE|nr:hypothetical protein AVEN_243123-1 [Araneus ventricosus]